MLTLDELAQYEWQMAAEGVGRAGQEKLKAASVLVSRVGGVGGAAAYYLAAAGVGRLILAHAGNLKPSDLNRQILMTHDHVGKPRIESAVRRLRELNPRVQIEGVAENISGTNARRLIERVDLVVSAAPLFVERFAMNRACVELGRPMVDAAMYDFDAQLTSIRPGSTPCLACLYPDDPPAWKRQFPVFGAVAGTIGAMAAAEAIKIICGVGEPLFGRLLSCNLREMSFRVLRVQRAADCAVCGGR